MEKGNQHTVHEIQDKTEFVCCLKCIVEVHHKRAVHLKTRQSNHIIEKTGRISLPASRGTLLMLQGRKSGTCCKKLVGLRSLC